MCQFQHENDELTLVPNFHQFEEIFIFILDPLDQKQYHPMTVIAKLFVCLGVYAVSTVFKLLNSDSSQIHVSWIIFNQYINSLLSWHWRASRSAIPIILSAKAEIN